MDNFLASIRRYITAARTAGVPLADETPEGGGEGVLTPPLFPPLSPTERRIVIDGEIPYILGRGFGMPPESFVEDGHLLILMALHPRHALYKDLGVVEGGPSAIGVEVT